MSMVFWTLIAWTSVASPMFSQTPPHAIDGPYTTLEQCRKDAKQYRPLIDSSGSLACEVHHVEEVVIDPKEKDQYQHEPPQEFLLTPPDENLDKCRELQLRGYTVACPDTLIMPVPYNNAPVQYGY